MTTVARLGRSSDIPVVGRHTDSEAWKKQTNVVRVVLGNHKIAGFRLDGRVFRLYRFLEH